MIFTDSLPLGGPTGGEVVGTAKVAKPFSFVAPCCCALKCASLGGDCVGFEVGALSLVAVSDPSVDKALGVSGGVFFGRGDSATFSVSFICSRCDVKDVKADA